MTAGGEERPLAKVGDSVISDQLGRGGVQQSMFRPAYLL